MENKVLKPLTSTYVFNIYDKHLNLRKKTMKLAKNGKRLTQNDLGRSLSDIERVFYFSSKNIVLNDLQEGVIIPVINDDNDPEMQLPSTIPSYLINDQGKLAVIVNLSNNMTKSKDGFYNIEPKILFSLLQAGSISRRCFTKYKKLQLNSSFIKSGVAVYSKLFTKTLNKLFSLNTIPDKLDSTYFLTGLFFLINCLGLDPNVDSTIQYALISCKNPNAVPARLLLSKFKKSDFENIDTFINALANNVSTFRDLKTRTFLDNYIQMYSPTMILSLEYLPIFLFNVFSVIVGSYVNNQYAIEQTCGRDLDILFKAFFSIV